LLSVHGERTHSKLSQSCLLFSRFPNLVRTRHQCWYSPLQIAITDDTRLLYNPGVLFSLRIQSGGRGIDCAWDYFNQGKVAEAIKASGVPRSELFITTKIPGISDPLEKVKADLKQLGIA
jgi:hypothetical protein